MNRRAAAILWVAAVVCGALGACAGNSAGGTSATQISPVDTLTFAPGLGIELSQFTRTRSGALYQDVQVGTGRTAIIGSYVTVRYVVALPDGTPAENQTEPLGFTLGQDVIIGLREGLTGMRTGGVRRLIVPPDLAYGRFAHNSIPPNSTLVFQVELVNVK
jgi:hypothetical protein